MTDINAAIAAAASGMRAQTVRMRIAAENVALRAQLEGVSPVVTRAPAVRRRRSRQ